MYNKDQLNQLEEQYFSGAPAFVIEIISTGGRNYDLKTKAANYKETKVREYWAVDPERRVLHRHFFSGNLGEHSNVSEHAQGRLESHVIGGFWINVQWLWQDRLPGELGCLEQILQLGWNLGG